jgi:hypothetical protein
MRLIYVDPELIRDVSQEAQLCRAVAKELNARGIRHQILIHASAPASLRDELDATAMFTASLQNDGFSDPIAGWLYAFFHTAELTWQDLKQLQLFQDDILYMRGGAAHLMALVRMRNTISQDRLPRTLFEITDKPEAERIITDDIETVRIPDPHVSSTALLLRFAAARLREKSSPNFFVYTCDVLTSQLCQKLMDITVGVLPTPAVTTEVPNLGPMLSHVGPTELGGISAFIDALLPLR